MEGLVRALAGTVVVGAAVRAEEKSAVGMARARRVVPVQPYEALGGRVFLGLELIADQGLKRFRVERRGQLRISHFLILVSNLVRADSRKR